MTTTERKRAGHGRRGALLLLTVLALGWAPELLSGEVVRVVVDRREVLLDGRPWGPYGAYEKLVGRVFFAFDPSNPANAAVVDLERAPRNSDGKVEAWANFMVLQPVDPDLRRVARQIFAQAITVRVR